MLSVVRKFSGATSRVDEAPYGARFMVNGPVVSSTVGAVIGAVVTDLAEAQPLVALCDYRLADMGVAARLVFAAHRGTGRPALWPAALVVPSDQLQLWRDYAWLQGQNGGLRGVFTSCEAAEKWCAEMAAIRESEIRYLKRVKLR